MRITLWVWHRSLMTSLISVTSISPLGHILLSRTLHLEFFFLMSEIKFSYCCSKCAISVSPDTSFPPTYKTILWNLLISNISIVSRMVSIVAPDTDLHSTPFRSPFLFMPDNTESPIKSVRPVGCLFSLLVWEGILFSGVLEFCLLFFHCRKTLPIAKTVFSRRKKKYLDTTLI